MILNQKNMIALSMAVVLILSGCSSSKKNETASINQDSQSSESTIVNNENEETKEHNDKTTEPKDEKKNDSKENKKDKLTSKQETKPSNSTVQKPNSSTNNTSKPINKPNNSGNTNTTPEKPQTENDKKPSKPEKHIHKWVKQSKGSIMDWENSCGPDENGYTTNREIAKNKNGKPIGIYMCARCYKYYGHPDNDDWKTRFWNHIEQDGPCKGGGYSTYPVYAIYELYHCKGCDSWKRGKISLYGYYDYSNNGAKWIYLEPWQIKELNLVMP